MSDLPSSWELAKLGDIVEVLDSRRVPVNAKARAKRPGDVPYYGATGQVGWIDEALFDEDLVLLGEDGAPFLDPDRQKAYRIHGPSWVNNHAHVLRARYEASSDSFLKYALDAVDYRPHVNGTTRLKLTQKAMCEIPIPIPPRAEQDRIVATIEEHLSRVDGAKTSLYSASQRLVAFQQRLIDEAVEGRPEKLSDLLTEPLRNGLSVPASSSGSVRVVTLTAVTKSSFVESHTKLIEPGVRSADDLWMEPGDIFVQRSNTPELVGTAAMYDGPSRWAIFPDLLIRVRVDQTRADPSYLELVLRSTSLRRYFRRSAQGIAGSMPKISQPIVEAARIPLPSLARQRSITRKMSDDLAIVRRMAAEVDRSVARTRSLRCATLTVALSGRLATQDPSDELASVSLNRIRAERVATTTQRNRARTAARR